MARAKAIPAAGTDGIVVLVFKTGVKLEFSGCTDIKEVGDGTEARITFKKGGINYVFKKPDLAGWGLPE